MSLRGLALAVFMLGVLGSVAAASPQKDLSSAASHEKVAFILVTDQGATGVDQARELIHRTMKQVKKSAFVEIDRSDPGNADLVARFRLAGAPVPLILIASRNGVIAGGAPAAQATSEQLVALVPSPKKGEILAALQAGKPVFIVVSRKGMQTESCSATCAAACTQLGDNPVTVQIDINDPQEATFLSQLKVDQTAKEPVTFVINSQGQITGSYAGAPDVATLVQAANKKGGGCAPGACGPGSGKSCGPTK